MPIRRDHTVTQGLSDKEMPPAQICLTTRHKKRPQLMPVGENKTIPLPKWQLSALLVCFDNQAIPPGIPTLYGTTYGTCVKTTLD